MPKWIKDVGAMLYDDAECKFLSWPRVDIGITLAVILLLVLAETGWGIQFSHWEYLMAAHGFGWAGYVSKKAFERPKREE